MTVRRFNGERMVKELVKEFRFGERILWRSTTNAQGKPGFGERILSRVKVFKINSFTRIMTESRTDSTTLKDNSGYSLPGAVGERIERNITYLAQKMKIGKKERKKLYRNKWQKFFHFFHQQRRGARYPPTTHGKQAPQGNGAGVIFSPAGKKTF